MTIVEGKRGRVKLELSIEEASALREAADAGATHAYVDADALARATKQLLRATRDAERSA